MRRSTRRTAHVDRLGIDLRRQTFSDTDDEQPPDARAEVGTRADRAEQEDGKYRDGGTEGPRTLQNIPEAPGPRDPRRTDLLPPLNPETEQGHRGRASTYPETRSPPRQEGEDHGTRPARDQYLLCSRTSHTPPEYDPP